MQKVSRIEFIKKSSFTSWPKSEVILGTSSSGSRNLFDSSGSRNLYDSSGSRNLANCSAASSFTSLHGTAEEPCRGYGCQKAREAVKARKSVSWSQGVGRINLGGGTRIW